MKSQETSTSVSRERRRTLRRMGAALTALGGVGVASETINAQSVTAPDAGVFGAGFSPEADLGAFLSGFVDRYRSGYGPPEDLETLADRARNEFAANEEVWLQYGDWIVEETGARPLGSVEIGVEFRLSRGRWPTTTGRVNSTISVDMDPDADPEPDGDPEDGVFQAVDWRLESPEDPDYQVAIADRAAEAAADELQRYRRTWIGDGPADFEEPSDEYLNQLAGRYFDLVSLGPTELSVVEVLLGEVER